MAKKKQLKKYTQAQRDHWVDRAWQNGRAEALREISEKTPDELEYVIDQLKLFRDATTNMRLLGFDHVNQETLVRVLVRIIERAKPSEQEPENG